MSQLLKFPAQKPHTSPTDHTQVLCASLDNRMAVCCFNQRGEDFLQLLEFHDEHPKWTVKINGLPSIGGISPSGVHLVTLGDMFTLNHIFLWDTRKGRVKAHLRADLIYPLDITFDSDMRFSFQYDTYFVPYVVSSSEFPISCHWITRQEPTSLVKGSQRKRYTVDDTYEWVISDSKRVCWIPLGYIGSGQPSYCWDGNSLFMVGQDGTLRKLTFREPM